MSKPIYDKTTSTPAQWEELASKQLAGPIIPEFTSFTQGDQGNYNGAYLPPKSLGCSKSTLMAILTDRAHKANAEDDHSKMLSKNELMILARWVDAPIHRQGAIEQSAASVTSAEPVPTGWGMFV